MYLVLQALTIHELQHQVTMYLCDGWELAGGVTTQTCNENHNVNSTSRNTVVYTSTAYYDIYYLQAIYKPKSKELL